MTKSREKHLDVPGGAMAGERGARTGEGGARTGEGGARTERLTKVYGTGSTAVRALEDVSVTLPGGRFTAIMGPSGAGKSTLMHCVAGLDAPTSGRVFVAGVDLGALSDAKLTRMRRERVGFVFQAFNLLPTLTAWDNILLPTTLAGTRPDSEWFDTVVRTLGLGERLGHRPAQLSGGQQQRVALARALITRPEIVFADEPTGNLDSHTGTEVLTLLRRSVDDLGQTVAMVTHDPAAAAHADSVIYLADGRIVDVMDAPTTDRVLDRMRDLGGAA
ncbi:ABC transporter ATP-binding protein [Spirillospora sp. NPDC052269]